MKRLEKLRFKLAHLLDKTQLFCWADLAMFGMGYGFKYLFKMRGRNCKEASPGDHCETCYCGKFHKGRLSVESDFADNEISEIPF